MANSSLRRARGRGFVAELEAIVGASHVLTSPSDMAPYLIEPRDLFKGAALCIVRPGSADEIAAVVKVCSKIGTPIVPQGGNTGLVGGQTPNRDDKAIVLSLQRMRALREIDLASNTMTVEAGMILARGSGRGRPRGAHVSPLARLRGLLHDRRQSRHQRRRRERHRLRQRARSGAGR